MSSDLRGFSIFLFFWGKGERGKGFRVANVNWGFEGRWGNKSGIWRFYRRVWKNIFYEKGDKERERGVLGDRLGWERGKGENFWVEYRKEQYTKYIVIKVN